MSGTTPVLDLIQRIRPWQLGELVKKALNITYSEHEMDGLKLWLDPGSLMGHRLLRDGHIERHMTDAILGLLEEGDTFVDVGANEAWFSLLAARKVGSRGRVLAAEPQERLWPVILRNFSMNGFAQCTLVPVAVGDTGDRAEILLAPTVNTGASSLVARSKVPYRKQSVVMRSLEWIVDAHGLDHVKLLKVDVEGFDLPVLRSGEALLAKRRVRHVLMELHAPEMRLRGEDPRDVHELFEKHGYRHEELPGEVHHFTCE